MTQNISKESQKGSNNLQNMLTMSWDGEFIGPQASYDLSFSTNHLKKELQQTKKNLQLKNDQLTTQRNLYKSLEGYSQTLKGKIQRLQATQIDLNRIIQDLRNQNNPLDELERPWKENTLLREDKYKNTITADELKSKQKRLLAGKVQQIQNLKISLKQTQNELENLNSINSELNNKCIQLEQDILKLQLSKQYEKYDKNDEDKPNNQQSLAQIILCNKLQTNLQITKNQAQRWKIKAKDFETQLQQFRNREDYNNELLLQLNKENAILVEEKLHMITTIKSLKSLSLQQQNSISDKIKTIQNINIQLKKSQNKLTANCKANEQNPNQACFQRQNKIYSQRDSGLIDQENEEKQFNFPHLHKPIWQYIDKYIENLPNQKEKIRFLNVIGVISENKIEQISLQFLNETFNDI